MNSQAWPQCPVCGKEFKARSDRLKLNITLCCSYKCRGMFKARPVAERFWEKVNKTETCWLWTGAIYKKSCYGMFSPIKGSTMPAHRFAWQLAHGTLPEGLDICHTCDVRRCVRLEHLFPGTRQDNMQDCVTKGRIARGQSHGMAKLSEAQVLEFRQRYAGGETVKQIHADSPLSLEATRACIRGWNWKHI